MSPVASLFFPERSKSVRSTSATPTPPMLCLVAAAAERLELVEQGELHAAGREPVAVMDGDGGSAATNAATAVAVEHVLP